MVQFQHNLGILQYVRTSPKCSVANRNFSHVCRFPAHPFAGLLVPAAYSWLSHSTGCRHTSTRIASPKRQQEKFSLKSPTNPAHPDICLWLSRKRFKPIIVLMDVTQFPRPEIQPGPGCGSLFVGCFLCLFPFSLSFSFGLVVTLLFLRRGCPFTNVSLRRVLWWSDLLCTLV